MTPPSRLAKKNITFSLPVEIVTAIEGYARSRECSVSSLGMKALTSCLKNPELIALLLHAVQDPEALSFAVGGKAWPGMSPAEHKAYNALPDQATRTTYAKSIRTRRAK